jgi:hypothetical protein
MRTNGTERSIIKSGSFENIIVHGNWIYYIDRANEYGEGYIHRMKLDGNGAEQLVGGSGGGNILSFVISFDKIYMIADDWGTGLYRVNLDGSMDGSDDDVYDAAISICATDNADYPVVFTINGVDKSLYACTGKTTYDGSNAVRLVVDADTAINYYDGYVYYIDSGKLSRVKLDGTNNTEVAETAALLEINIAGGQIFCFDTEYLPLYFIMGIDGRNFTPLVTPPVDNVSTHDFNYTGTLRAVSIIPETSAYRAPDDDNNIPVTLCGIDYHFVEWILSEDYYLFDDNPKIRWIFYKNNAAVMAAVNNSEVDIAVIPAEYFEKLSDKSNYRSLMDSAS